VADRFFGKRWDAPAFEDAEQVQTPVGSECGYCAELFEEGDRGLWMNWLDSQLDQTQKPIHLECFLRSILGSPAHQLGTCSCSGGEEPEDARTWREQGLEVMRMIQDKEGIWSAGVAG
jgi:hypothetical protein